MKKLPVFTLGVEEEYQIIDPETRDLRSHLSKIVDGAKTTLHEQVKAEMHQSVVEAVSYTHLDVYKRQIFILLQKII